MFYLVRNIFLIFSLFFVTSCREGRSVDFFVENEQDSYLKGQRLLKEGREKEALSAFLKVIDELKVAPESHLEVGQLYLRHMDDPLTAMYHFRKYLEYCPETQQSQYVRQMIETCQKEFIKKLPGKPFASAVEKADIIDALTKEHQQVLALKKELVLTKRQVVDLQSKLSQVAQNKAIKPAEYDQNVQVEQAFAWSKPQPNSQKNLTFSFYTVQTGDTLTRISNKVYGASSRWNDIFKANQDQLKSPKDLRPGQKLKIP